MAFSRTSQQSDVTLWTSSSVASDSVTLATVNAGDFIYVLASGDSGSNPTITVSDPTNGSYTAKLKVNHTGDQCIQQFYFKNSAAASSLVITANFSPSRPFVAMYAAAWSGADTATGFDIEAGQDQSASWPGTGTDAIDTTNQTTTQADLILAGCLQVASVGLTATAGTGFSEDSNFLAGASNASRFEFEHKTQGAAGSDHATWTTNQASGATCLSVFMAVKPLASGSGVVPPFVVGDLSGIGSGGRFFKDPLQ